ncbi:MAG: hypothetical protein ACUVR2_06010 [Anaerolineae bacterium]
MVKRLFRLCILLLSAPAIYVLADEARSFFVASASFLLRNGFLYGFIVYMVIYPFIPQDRMKFLEVFEHELGHTILGTLLSRNVKTFVVEAKDSSAAGLVAYTGRENALIALAPYFLPIFTLPLLVLKPLLFSQAHVVIDFLIGVSLAFHYIGLAKEFRISQKDIWRSGILFSLGFTFILNLVFLVVIVCVALNRYGDIINYFRNAYAKMPVTYALAWQMVQKIRQAIPIF